MQDAPSSLGAGTSPEPRGFTLIDLSMLVVGFAIVFAMPLLPDDWNSTEFWLPSVFTWLVYAYIAIQKSGLILIPVILARRARYGGWPQPAEWLALLVGLPNLHELIDGAGWAKGFARWYLVVLRPRLGDPVPRLMHQEWPNDNRWFPGGYWGFPVDFTAGDEHRIWGGFAAILLLGVLMALGITRRKLPDWIQTAFLLGAILIWQEGLAVQLEALLGRTFHWWAGHAEVSPGFLSNLALGLAGLPESLVFAVPIVGALAQWRRGRQRSWSWVGWSGILLACLLLILRVGLIFQGNLMIFHDGTSPSLRVVRWAIERAVSNRDIEVVQWAISGALGVWIARRFGNTRPGTTD